MGGSSKGGSQTQTVTTPEQTTITPVSRSVSVIVGYRYFLGAHMALTHGPVDFVSRIKVGDKCAWSGISYGKPNDGSEVNINSSGVRINISASNLFGGVDGEGGVSGPVDFLQGYDTQAVNDYLAARLGGASGTPAFRGVTSMVLRQVYVSANNPYLKPWQFTMSRFSQDWNPQKSQISIFNTEPGDPPDYGGIPVSEDSVTNHPDLESNISISGGTSIRVGDWRILRATNSPATITVSNTPMAVEYLIVGGGGEAWFVSGEGSGAGGGGGQVRRGKITLPPGSYSISLGTGGSSTKLLSRCADDGGVSSAFGLTAIGGGGGCPRCTGAGTGFHGGGAASRCSGPTTEGDPGNGGNKGGDYRTSDTHWNGGGGGGHGGAGGNGGPDGLSPGNGGPGLRLNFWGEELWFSEGGAGRSSLIGSNAAAGFGSTNSPRGPGSGGTHDGVSLLNGSAGTVAVRFLVYDGDIPTGEGDEIVSTCNSGPCIDMNPAHIIRECLTDKEWGMGYSVDDIDDDSFTAAAETLFDEELGISLLWDRETTIEAFIKEVTRHIDAALYVDRRTGKFVLKLIRDDYSASDLITLDPTNIERVENYRRPSFGELVNTVTVLYMECPDDVQGSVTVQDIALIQAQGGSIGATVEYMGFSNRRNAQYAATRDLRQLALPLLSCTIYTGPDAASLDIGDTFKFEWPDYHEDSITMRVTGMAFGDGKTSRIRIDCVQDVFGTPEAPLLSDDVSLWNNPNQPPGPVEHQIVEEAPYWLGVRVISDLDARLAESPDVGGFCAAAADPPSGLFDTSDGSVYYGNAISATINQNDGTEWVQVGLMDFCPFATVAGSIDSEGTAEGGIGYLDDTILIADASGLDLVSEGTFAQMGNEIVRIDSINLDSDGDPESITVGRGCLDTVPTPHDAGTRIFFWQQFFGSDYDQYFAGDAYTYALRPRNNTGILPLADAPTIEHTFDSRAIRPYPPGNVRINGQYYPTHLNGELLSLEWSHRDRAQQTGEVIIDTLESDIGPESGTTYTVRIEDDFGGLIVEETGISGTTWDEDSSSMIEDASFVIKLYSERDIASSSDPYQSWQQHVIPMLRNAPVDSSSGFGSSDIFASSSETVVEWTPAQITTALWLDAADADTITLNGSNLSQLDDKSGNNKHATQSVSARQPAFSVANGVEFTLSTFLTTGSVAWPEEMTILAVAQRGSGMGGTNRLVNVDADSRFYMGLRSSFFNASWGTGSAWVGLAAATPNRDPVDFSVIGALRNAFGASGAVPIFNGENLDAVDGGTWSGSAPLILGGRSDAPRPDNQGWIGNLKELILIPTSATDIIDKAVGYLAWKWGLEANLPSGHPYEDAPPTV